MACTYTQDMRRYDEARSFHDSRVDCVAEINCRPFRIEGAKVTQTREAVPHVLAGEAQRLERFAR